MFADLNFPFMDICGAWGNPDLGPRFRAPVRSTVPVLFISGTLDAKTPPANAEEVRRGFPNGEHLIVEGAVHSDPLFLSSPRIAELMMAFMEGKPLATASVRAPPLKFPMTSPFEPGK